MINTIIGKKQEMTVKFSHTGVRVPVTSIMAEPNSVIKFEENKALIGLGKQKRIKKTDGMYQKSIGSTPKFIKEVKNQKTEGSEGKNQQTVTVSVFEPGDEVRITGTTKGKGFAGGVKRWGFSGGPKTHGQSDRHRAPGSLGAGTTPGRVFKGKKMAGHMGAVQLTVRGLEIVDVDAVNNLIFVKGAVPGNKNSFVVIEKTGKVKNYSPPPAPKEEGPEEQTQEAKKDDNQNQNLDPVETKQDQQALDQAANPVTEENKDEETIEEKETENASE